MQKRQLFQTKQKFKTFMKESENRVKESEVKLWKREQEEERKKKDHLRDRNQLILQQDFLKQMSIMPEIE